MARLTVLQRILLNHIEAVGGRHVYISRSFVPPVGSELHGYSWEGVHLSLVSLVRRGLLYVVKANFFYLPEKTQLTIEKDQPHGLDRTTP